MDVHCDRANTILTKPYQVSEKTFSLPEGFGTKKRVEYLQRAFALWMKAPNISQLAFVQHRGTPHQIGLSFAEGYIGDKAETLLPEYREDWTPAQFHSAQNSRQKETVPDSSSGRSSVYTASTTTSRQVVFGPKCFKDRKLDRGDCQSHSDLFRVRLASPRWRSTGPHVNGRISVYPTKCDLEYPFGHESTESIMTTCSTGIAVTVHQTPDAGRPLSATLLKANFVRGPRSSLVRNALSVARRMG